MRRPQSIIEALDEIRGLDAEPEMPSAGRLESIRALVAGSLKPVRPLPSNGALALMVEASFVALAGLVTIPLGFAGYRHLLSGQKLTYYSVILLAAAVLSVTLLKEIIPGSRRLAAPLVSVGMAIVSVAVIAFALFPQPDFDGFAKLGLPCLGLGTTCAGLSGFLMYLFLRTGFSSAPVRTASIGGLLAGLTGFAILALHCQVQNSAHILVWHLGAMLIAGAGGALIAIARPGRRA